MKKLNYKKYGFKFHRKSNSGTRFYRKETGGGGYVELMVSFNNVSIYCSVDGDYEITIASRYQCESQEDLDFLLLNGRVGNLLK